MNSITRTRHVGITVVCIFAIISGVNEIVVGITGNFLGILSKPLKPSLATAIVGAFYSLGGLSLLTRKRWGAVLGILFIGAEILGRLYLVEVGIVPSKGGDALKVVVGGVIALAVILYIWSQWKHFD
jgi:hypothetical protein